MDFYYCDFWGSSRGMKFVSDLPLPTDPNIEQPLLKTQPRSLRQSQPANRNHRLSQTLKSPCGDRTLHQWETQGHLREEFDRRADPAEGRAAEGCEWREDQEDEEAGYKY